MCRVNHLPVLEPNVSVFRVIFDTCSFYAHPKAFIPHSGASNLSRLSTTVRAECELMTSLSHRERVPVTTSDRCPIRIGVVQKLKVDVDVTDAVVV